MKGIIEETLSNEDDVLHCFYSITLDKYCLEFNAKLFTYTYMKGYINKKNKLVKKYNLKHLCSQ